MSTYTKRRLHTYKKQTPIPQTIHNIHYAPFIYYYPTRHFRPFSVIKHKQKTPHKIKKWAHKLLCTHYNKSQNNKLLFMLCNLFDFRNTIVCNICRNLFQTFQSFLQITLFNRCRLDRLYHRTTERAFCRRITDI